jgi:GAF domain-containing protein
MKVAALPDNEAERLAVLHRYKILDTGLEQAFDNLTKLAAQICFSPIALITFVDETRHWFKAKCGLSACETSRELGFCAHAILQPQDVMIVPDALQDERFADNPLVLDEPYVRFYAGAPLVSPDGYPLGTICVIDQVPRELENAQIQALEMLAQQVISQLELRLTLERLAQMNHTMHQYLIEVDWVTRSAAALEEGNFQVEELDEVAQRPDELGQLARVFQRAAQSITQREAQMQQQIVDLKVEVDEVKRSKEVAQITQSSYFSEVRQALAETNLDEFWS